MFHSTMKEHMLRQLKLMRALFCLSAILACQGVEDEAMGDQKVSKVVKSSSSTLVTIDTAPRHNISPYIYGFGTYLEKDRIQDGMFALRPTAYRFGGNTSDRFNWQLNAFNTGKDWFFMNAAIGQPGGIDRFIQDNQSYGVASAVTLPLLGWVAKDSSSVSYPKSAYPQQQQFEKDAGNGLGRDGKELKADPARTSMKVDTNYLVQWVNQLKTKFGPYPHLYILGNEPMLWHETHRDVHPERETYDSYLQKYIAAALVVRQADPQAVLIGPALWGWLDTQYSAADLTQQNQDRQRHGDVPFLEWFVKEVVKKERTLGVSLIDVVDVHYYPQEQVLYSQDSSASVRQQRLNSTRSLWDRTYKDNSWINEKLYFIPRMQSMIASIKPSLKFMLGEYNFRGEQDLSGATAQAEVLGIFADQNLYAAYYWTDPPKDSLIPFAWRIYRNYDGLGAAFGNTYLQNSYGIHQDASVFTAQDPKRNVITVVIVNKSVDRQQNFQLQWGRSASTIKKARLFQFDHRRPNELVKSDIPLSNGIAVTTEPLSVQMIELSY